MNRLLPERAEAAFARNFAEQGELGASLAIWQDGRPLLNLGAGTRDRARTEPWDAETLVLVWSATKGPASACLLHLLEQENIALSTPVAKFWPEFAQGGKATVTIGHVLSHRAGLAALDHPADAFDHETVAAALAAQVPQWEPGAAHGYHPRTFGYLLDELIRRISEGMPLSHYWRRVFGEPMQLKFWMGVPEELVGTVAPVFAAGASERGGETAFYSSLADPTSLAARAFSSPAGPGSVSAMNSARVRQHALPSFGGIGTSGALAQFYAMLASGGAWRGERYFEPKTLRLMETAQSIGQDRVLLMPTSFAAGFMKDPIDAAGIKTRQTFGPSLRAFGQPGAGGSLAFADPEHGIGFAYVMNRMGAGVLPNVRASTIVHALYGDS